MSSLPMNTTAVAPPQAPYPAEALNCVTDGFPYRVQEDRLTHINLQQGRVINVNCNDECIVPNYDSSIEDLTASFGKLSSRDIIKERQKHLHHTSTKFHQFQKLPAGVRIKIWGFAACQTRFLEVEWNDLNPERRDSHYHYRLAAKSRLPPAIIHCNYESRQQALRFYSIVDFTSNVENMIVNTSVPSCGPQKSYYNDISDIIYFGEFATCMNTIVRFFEDQSLRQVPLRNIAIAISTGPNTELCTRFRVAIRFGIEPLQALYGVDPEEALNDIAGDVPDLKNVYFVVPSSLVNLCRGYMDESITYRPAVYDGMSKSQRDCKRDHDRWLESLEDYRPWGEAKGSEFLKNWAGDKAPTFEFISFCPVAAPNKVFDAMNVERYEFKKFKKGDFLQSLEVKHNVHIKIAKKEYVKQNWMEIGIYGEARAVKLVKDALHWRINKWTRRHIPMEPREHWDQEYFGWEKMMDIPVSRYHTGLSASSRY